MIALSCDIAGRFFGLVKRHACDRRTDGQNYDSQDRPSIAASRGENKLEAKDVLANIKSTQAAERTEECRFCPL